MSESHIIEPVLENLGAIDPSWSGAACVREAQIGRGSGYVDLLVLPPQSAQHRVVLVEGKRLDNDEASAKVLGQLLKYYAHARRLGREGLDRIRTTAGEAAVRGVSYARWSLARLLGAGGQDEACGLATLGEPLGADEIALVIALDQYGAKLHRRLGMAVLVLAGEEHRLPITVVEVVAGTVRRMGVDELVRV